MLALVLSSLLLSPAFASDAVKGDPAEVADYRDEAFSGIAKHMKALSLMAKGKVELSKADLVLHAKAIALAGEAMPGWFPAGTGPDKAPETEALPAIWSKPDEFKAAIQTFQTASAGLLAAAESGDAKAVAAKLGDVGPSCGNCHDSFRKDD